MDENEKSTSEPVLITRAYEEDGSHTTQEVPYSSLPIEKLVDLAIAGSLEARKEVEKRCGADLFKDLGA